MVLYGQPVTALTSISIEREGLVVDRIRHEQRNKFLRVLVRPIGIAASGHHDRKPIGRPIAERQEISTGFASRIGTSRSQAIILRRRPSLDASIYFIRADLQKSLHPSATSLFKQYAGSHHIGPCKGSGVENR